MNYIKGLNGLRAISIFMVLLAHLGLRWSLPKSEFFLERFWPLISGDTGVMVFFVISGFLITSLLLDEKKRNGSINLKFFFIRRFLRLLPPLMLMMIFAVVLMFLDLIPISAIGLIYSFFYIYNFIPKANYTGELAHTWSLAVEEQFYFTWPFVLAFIKNPKIILGLTFVIVGSCVALFIFNQSSDLANDYHINRWFLPAISPIIMGAIIAILKDISVRFMRSLGVFIIGLVLFLSPLYVPFELLTYLSFIQSLGVSCILLWIYHNQSSFFIKALELKPLFYIGQISYGIYIFQGVFLTTGPSLKWWMQSYPYNILLTFAVAVLSYHLIEQPILKYKEKYKV
jgi:peptidoglycan/LPS O-acetylase OafA/YrhL